MREVHDVGSDGDVKEDEDEEKRSFHSMSGC